jgi:aryl-alcohol dehydrogenase-like predicted oxidoreductase
MWLNGVSPALQVLPHFSFSDQWEARAVYASSQQIALAWILHQALICFADFQAILGISYANSLPDSVASLALPSNIF